MEMAGWSGSLRSKVVAATGMSNTVACRMHRSDSRSLCSQRSHYLLLEIQDFRIAVLFLFWKVHGEVGCPR